jgi:dTDP-4-dehydrorhamnose 3,5-epimerase
LWCLHDLHRNEIERRIHHRPRAPRRQPRIFCPHVLQYPPAAETKYVRCTRGGIIDIIVDLRPESPTYLEHISVELSADNQRGLYIPERFGHGYITLEDKTDTTYMVGEFYTPGVEGGFMYNDPMLGLEWPIPVEVISEKDNQWKALAEIEADMKKRMAI